jgi:3-mercaptopyruvate sulfurtransferase SseA
MLYDRGHIPGAKSVPWTRAANADGSFKSAKELRTIYEQEFEWGNSVRLPIEK